MTGPEVTVTGGSTAVVLVTLAVALLTIVVGTWVALTAYQGYRRSGEQSTYFLAVGIALAAAVHASTRVVLSTVNAPSLLVNSIAIAVQSTGLIFVLYAVYGNPDRSAFRVALGAVIGGSLVLSLPLVLAWNAVLLPMEAITVANSITAGLGTFIAIQAYRGYHRYGRRSMLMLAVGIGLLTLGSFTALNAPVSQLSDAIRIGLVLTVEFTGLLFIAISLHRN